MSDQINTRALFHDGSVEYLIPMEPKPGEEIRIFFRTAKDNVDSVQIFINQNPYHMWKKYHDQLFDYYEYCYVCPEEEFSYHFEANKNDTFCFYDMKGAGMDPVSLIDFRITPGFSTPDWAKGAVMYQIFTERFANGDPSNDVETDEYSYINEHVTKVTDWNKLPAAMGVREFYGGDLQGVLDKLDYLEKLGVEVIYFNPLFVSPSNHKYDIQDYDYIDPHFGKIVEDEEDGLLAPDDKDNRHAKKFIKRVTDKKNLEASNAFFAHVVEEIHKRGMKVILDGVFNHCGSFNKWLDRERIYSGQPGYEDGAYVSKDSPYRDFFKFYKEDAWPENGSYDGWWGHDTLPKLNYEGSKKLYDYILRIGAKWVSAPYNVDGWRLDVAADLGFSEEMNHRFWRDFRKAVREANPNAIILAEHYGDPENWLHGDQWDTVMNYDAFMEPISWFLTGMEKHSDAYQKNLLGNGEVFDNSMKYAMAKFQEPSLLVAMNELSNHDHSRFLTRTNGKVGRTASVGAEAADRDVDKAVMKEAVVMQMTWPGAPTIYYGEEAGLCGWTDPDNRRAYPWGHEDFELMEFYRDAIYIHKSNKALRTGAFKMLKSDYNILVYGRMLKDNIIVTVINNNDEDKDIVMPVWELGGTDQMKVVRLMETHRDSYNVGHLPLTIEDGTMMQTVKAKSACIYRIQAE